MPKTPKPAADAAALTAEERIILFVVALDIDHAAAGITAARMPHQVVHF